MFKFLSIRLVNFLALVAVVALLALASYLQRVKGLEPCPLCMVQRLFFFALAATFFIGILLPTWVWPVRIHNVFVILFAGLGLAAVGRQLWLIHFSNTVASCGADFYYMLTNLPLGELFAQVMQGQGDCTKEAWHILGISLPEWSGLAFLFFLGIGIWQFVRVRK